MSQEFWAITAFFNPMHWRRRLANYRVFRRNLRIPLVAVELGYGGHFELGTNDADILIQIPSRDVLWQKERLMNVALAAVPPEIDNIACLDCDVILDLTDVWQNACHILEKTPIAQLFSHAFYLQPDFLTDDVLTLRALAPAMSFASLRQQGHAPLELCNPIWSDPSDAPPVTYGMATAFRRELFAQRGMYDAWIIGGGTRVHFYAGHGFCSEAAEAFQFYPAMYEHFRRWTTGFHAEVKGQWGCVPGAVAHLWHGDMARRKHRQRYQDFARFEFDPGTDIALDDYGAWQWNSHKPEMHQYICDYFAGRQEDTTGETPAESSRTAPIEIAA